MQLKTHMVDFSVGLATNPWFWPVDFSECQYCIVCLQDCPLKIPVILCDVVGGWRLSICPCLFKWNSKIKPIGVIKDNPTAINKGGTVIGRNLIMRKTWCFSWLTLITVVRSTATSSEITNIVFSLVFLVFSLVSHCLCVPLLPLLPSSHLSVYRSCRKARFSSVPSSTVSVLVPSQRWGLRKRQFPHSLFPQRSRCLPTPAAFSLLLPQRHSG